MPPQTKAPAAVPAEPKSMTLPRKNPDYISPALPASAAMVRAEIIAGLEAMERGVSPGKRTAPRHATQLPVFCFCKAELFCSIAVAGGTADLGDLTLVNPEAQPADLETDPGREISVFDNLTQDGALVPEPIETCAGNWTLYDRGPAPAPRRTAPIPPPGSGATPLAIVTPENTMPAGPWRSSAHGLVVLVKDNHRKKYSLHFAQLLGDQDGGETVSVFEHEILRDFGFVRPGDPPDGAADFYLFWDGEAEVGIRFERGDEARVFVKRIRKAIALVGRAPRRCENGVSLGDMPATTGAAIAEIRVLTSANPHLLAFLARAGLAGWLSTAHPGSDLAMARTCLRFLRDSLAEITAAMRQIEHHRRAPPPPPPPRPQKLWSKLRVLVRSGFIRRDESARSIAGMQEYLQALRAQKPMATPRAHGQPPPSFLFPTLQADAQVLGVCIMCSGPVTVKQRRTTYNDGAYVHQGCTGKEGAVYRGVCNMCGGPVTTADLRTTYTDGSYVHNACLHPDDLPADAKEFAAALAAGGQAQEPSLYQASQASPLPPPEASQYPQTVMPAPAPAVDGGLAAGFAAANQGPEISYSIHRCQSEFAYQRPEGSAPNPGVDIIPPPPMFLANFMAVPASTAAAPPPRPPPVLDKRAPRGRRRSGRPDLAAQADSMPVATAAPTAAAAASAPVAAAAHGDYRGDCCRCRLPVTTDHSRLRYDDGSYVHQLCHEAAKTEARHRDEAPPPLRTPSVPQGWGVAYDNAGSLYYYNIHTNATTWDLPDKSALPDASVPCAVPPDAAAIGTDATAAASRTLFHEDGTLRSPVGGLFHDNLPVPRTLEDALHEVTPLFDPEALRAQVVRARQKARTLARSLPEEWRAALVLYTMESTPPTASVYHLMNGALRDQSRQHIRPWRDYIWMVLHSLRSLPSVQTSVLFRGVKLSAADLGAEYRTGESFLWAGFTSTTTTIESTKRFLGSAGDRTLFILNMATQIGKDVRPFSLHPGEDEVVLPPNLEFEVVGVLPGGDGITMLQCRQVMAVDSLLVYS